MSSAGVITISPTRDESALISPVHRHHSSESILVFVTTPDKIVPIRVLESDTIESVKFKIQNCKGVVLKNQKLVSGGRELARSNSSVRDYGVGDGDVVHVCVRLSDLQHINVRTACGKEFFFDVERNRDIGYIKRQIGLVDIDEHEILWNGERVDDQRLINDLSKNNEAVVHLFVCKTGKISSRPLNKNFELSVVQSQLNDKRDFDVNREINSVINAESNNHVIFGKYPFKEDILLEPIIVNNKVKLPSVVLDMIKSNYEGLVNGSVPIRSSEGTGGTYFMLDSTESKYLSVFKPIDEEPMAANNPRGLPLSEDGEGLKKGTRVGQGALREVAAYVLDHPKVGLRSFSDEVKGFAGVPPTIMVKCLHAGFHHPQGLAVKIGSLQMFMENSGSCEDMGPSTFPVGEVHKISVFDIRMANADRHAGNILVSKDEDGKILLIPIDHGYCLPESFEDCTFEWLYWPQARQPYSPDTIKYIMSLDAEEDIALLNFHGWDLPETCARILRISTMLLKKGVERGFTPFEIGNIMCRETLKKESVIEEIFREALDSVLPGTSEAAFLEAISQIMDVRLDEIAK